MITNTKGYAKNYLTKTMNDWHSGLYLNPRAKIVECSIYTMGYKCCQSKVIILIFNKNMGNTAHESQLVYKVRGEVKN